MARMSNRDRIARAADEARLAEAEKLAKKAAKRPPKPRAKDVRMKIVWEVCNARGKPVKTFAYPRQGRGHDRGSAALQRRWAAPPSPRDQSPDGLTVERARGDP